MRLTTEKVLNDIETYLEETAELPWGTAHIILMEAKEQINSLQRQLDNKELTDEEMDTIVRDFFGEVDSFYDFRLVIRRCIRKAQEKCNGFCGEYECKENQSICKRKAQEK